MVLKKLLPLIFTFHFYLFAFAQPYSPSETKAFYSWGNQSSVIRKLQYGKRNDIIMLSLHSNEQTSVEAAKQVLQTTGGLLIILENSGERLISFVVKGRKYRIDPNRIFSQKGMRKNFKELNKYRSETAIRKIDQFAKFLLRQLPSNIPLIALHNNDQGRLSVYSFTKGGSMAKDAEKTSVNRMNDPDDFFLTTDKQVFKFLKKKNFNVVLQNNKHAEDDGSLSVYYGRHNRSYTNVEAGHGHLQQQVLMLNSLLNNK